MIVSRATLVCGNDCGLVSVQEDRREINASL